MNHLQRTIALTLILIVATLTPIALQVEGPPMPPYTPTPTVAARGTQRPTMFPSPTCPANCETPALPPRRCPTCTPLPTPAATPYPPALATPTPRPQWKVYLATMRKGR